MSDEYHTALLVTRHLKLASPFLWFQLLPWCYDRIKKMSMKNFEDPLAWQRGMDLNVAVDIALSGSRNFGFKDQLFRAALSICNNIAEGYEMPTTANQIKYLWIAKGSCNEVHSMLILAKRRGYFSEAAVDEMIALQDQIGKLLRTSIKQKAGKWSKLPGSLLILSFWVNLTLLYP